MTEEPEHVTAVVRIRPIIEGEQCRQLGVTHVHPSGSRPQVVAGKRHFTVDHVFGMHSETKSIFEEIVRPHVQSFCLDGVNGTVMAYGQTGAGKTHTVQGLVPLLLSEIVAHAPLADLEFSCIEVYGDEIRDLFTVDPLPPKKPLTVTEGSRGTPEVVGATRLKVETLEEAVGIFQMGLERRCSGETSMNSGSSRSHCVFTVIRHLPGRLTSVYNVVDLAGSERQKRTNNVGIRFKESIGINSCLLALGNVIRALAERKEHIPYRACKLTRILQGALGGDSRTIFIACIAPNTVNVDETIRTLQYSCKAMQIVNLVHPAALEALVVQQKEVDDAFEKVSPTTPKLSSALPQADYASRMIQALQQEVSTLKNALLSAQETLQKDEIIFREKFKVLKRLHKENTALRTRLQDLEKEASGPSSEPRTVARPIMVSTGTNTESTGNGSGNYLPDGLTPSSGQAGPMSTSNPPSKTSPLSVTLHEQISTIASKYEGACDFVGGVPVIGNLSATPKRLLRPSPAIIPVSPSKKLDFSSSRGSEEEVELLRSNNAALAKQLQSMINQNEQLTRENANLSRELQEVVALVSSER
jgi:hypothetical protein